MEKLIQKRINHLVVRPFEACDFDAWRETYSSLAPARNVWDLGPRAPTELTRAHFRKLLRVQREQRRRGDFFDFAGFRKSDGKFVGAVALMDVSRGVFQNAYLGYRVFNPWWGQGIGKELVSVALGVAFTDLRLHRVEAGIDPKNRRSIFLARSMGLRKEGLKKRALYLNGVWQDILVYAATCEDLGLRYRGNRAELSLRIR
jgi:ribosomal-protein-alanine N-acetyltransferase